jgi:hypothetical protein
MVVIVLVSYRQFCGILRNFNTSADLMVLVFLLPGKLQKKKRKF